jgi:hypothetical protein
MRNVSGKVEEKIKTHILCLIMSFEHHAIYDTMWKDLGEPERPEMTT